MEIKSLGYIGFGAKDPQEWLKFGTEIIGMMPARAVPGESWGFPQDPNFETPVNLTKEQEELIKQLDESFGRSKSKHSPRQRNWYDSIKDFFE